MPSPFLDPIGIKHAIIISITLAVLFVQSCSDPHNKSRPIAYEPETPNVSSSEKVQHEPPKNRSSSLCIDVYGTSLGDVIPGSRVYFYPLSDVNYSVVMSVIRAISPRRSAAINNRSEFNFTCVYPGNYTFVIPASSYNRSVGFPLPYEFDCKNLSLRIVFHGGDINYSVGVFTLKENRMDNASAESSSQVSIRKEGTQYHECPLVR